MTHEFKKILRAGRENGKKGVRNVLATVVALDGSSYRRPGVRMLISEDGRMTGAVSGGCVEKEVLLQSESVFKDNVPRVMTYDGRYRLGCEGILYILLEPFNVNEDLFEKLEKQFTDRKSFSIRSAYRKTVEASADFGSVVSFDDGTKAAFSGKVNFKKEEKTLIFEQELKPLFKMVIIGAEHDAVQLCSAASLLGWEVSVVASPKDPRTPANFPGATEVLHLMPEEAATALQPDGQTAIVLMNHSYATDLKFLLALKNVEVPYIGLLGAVKRREKLLNELIEHHPEIREEFLDNIYGPAGLNIGAETPQEIAVSILGEILSVVRNKKVFSLREKSGAIHT